MSRGRVLITNATSDAGLSVARSIARAGYEVSTADVVDMPLGVKSRFASAHYVLANDGDDSYAAALVELIDRIRPDAFLPVGMQAVVASVAHRDRLRATTALNVPGPDAMSVANDKAASAARLEALGIPSARIRSYPEAAAALSGVEAMTMVVKPRAHIGAAHGVSYVTSAGELDHAIDRCRTSYGDYLIQEFVPGDSNAMKTAILLYSAKSQLVAAFTTRKTREWPTTGGLTVVSQSTRDEGIVSQLKPFFDQLRWQGPVEVELKHDARTGTDKVIEINPRFPGYLRFAECCGLDLPAIAVHLALKDEAGFVQYPAYRIGATYINPGLLIKSAGWHVRRTGVAEVPRIIAEFRAGFQCAVDMLRDPLPFVGRVLAGPRS